ncbi:putative CXXCH cytochrome family protein [Bradyrhizobium sp. i1.8.4]|uniref:tetratricopeptide repeat protein n=1 Tax=unclassified Bradyrhizobium TaxID=2631580 RepID=UPI003D19C68B
MTPSKSRSGRSNKRPGHKGRNRNDGISKSEPSANRIRIIAAVTALLLIGCGLVYWLVFGTGTHLPFEGRKSAASPDVAKFVGSETCAGCHREEADLWRQSQHKHAMDHATEKTVLGDFNNASFEHFGTRSRFFRKDGKFFVETDGPDGSLTEYEIKYTFGIDPLQQYLIEFPDGRLQALTIAWDARPKEKGGQRWFHLYPDEKIDHGDILHWTKLNQNWNFMCSECHSTGVRKNYDSSTNRFNTTWAEISVGCEACHGQGSNHVGWASAKKSMWPFGKTDDEMMGLLVRFTERRDVSWSHEKNVATAARSLPPATLRKEVETCGLCHARRGQISENWIPGQWLSETHTVSPLSRGLYYPDGQMQDEVYNYGSFKQSKMFAAGVTCSDCHDPHSGKTRLSGDNVCLQCHAPESFAVPSHRQHAAVTPPPTCASCHMPIHTYMVVDQRHDHSFRVPRPDLSVQLGTPNACNDCHKDKPAEWAAAAIERWHGPERKGFQAYGPAFHAAWTDQIGAAASLASIAVNAQNPGFARAGALAELNVYLSPDVVNIARTGLNDPDPMVRIGALDMLNGIPVQRLWPIAASALADPVRGVRIRAASLLAGLPASLQPPEHRADYEKAAQEFIEAQRLNADRPEGRTTLGTFFAREGQVANAEAEYLAALRLSDQYAPAAVNLANLYAQQRREDRAEAILRKSIASAPRDAALRHALGLTLVRAGRPQEALEELHHASDLQPDQARYAYVYAIALHSSGRVSDAIRQLEGNAERHPADRDTLSALVNFNRETGNAVSALKYAEQLARIVPNDQDIARIVRELEETSKKQSRP